MPITKKEKRGGGDVVPSFGKPVSKEVQSKIMAASKITTKEVATAPRITGDKSNLKFELPSNEPAVKEEVKISVGKDASEAIKQQKELTKKADETLKELIEQMSNSTVKSEELINEKTVELHEQKEKNAGEARILRIKDNPKNLNKTDRDGANTIISNEKERGEYPKLNIVLAKKMYYDKSYKKIINLNIEEL